MIIDQYNNLEKIEYTVCKELIKKVFYQLGLQINRSGYNDNGFWAEHSPGTEENWINIRLSIEFFPPDEDDELGRYLAIAKFQSLDENFPAKRKYEIGFDSDQNFDQIVGTLVWFISNTIKIMGQ